MANNTRHMDECSYLINKKSCNCGAFEFIADNTFTYKYTATFYYFGNEVHKIGRNNRKYLMSAAHRWMSNQYQKWDRIIIDILDENEIN